MVTDIIVHCAYTKPSMDIGVTEIRKWHTDPKPQGRGWLDIGYQYVIRRNGMIEKGRDLDKDGDVDDETGAHTLGHNKNTIGICLVGGMGDEGEPDCNFKFHQYLALYNLVTALQAKHPEAKIHGHRDYANKECPCFDAHEFFDG